MCNGMEEDYKIPEDYKNVTIHQFLFDERKYHRELISIMNLGELYANCEFSQRFKVSELKEMNCEVFEAKADAIEKYALMVDYQEYDGTAYLSIYSWYDEHDEEFYRWQIKTIKN